MYNIKKLKMLKESILGSELSEVSVKTDKYFVIDGEVFSKKTKLAYKTKLGTLRSNEDNTETFTSIDNKETTSNKQMEIHYAIIDVIDNLEDNMLNENKNPTQFWSKKAEIDFKQFLLDIDKTSEYEIAKAMGGKDKYIDTPGDWRDLDKETKKSFNNDIEEYYKSNSSDFYKLKKWWEDNIKK